MAYRLRQGRRDSNHMNDLSRFGVCCSLSQTAIPYVAKSVFGHLESPLHCFVMASFAYWQICKSGEHVSRLQSFKIGGHFDGRKVAPLVEEARVQPNVQAVNNDPLATIKLC